MSILSTHTSIHSMSPLPSVRSNPNDKILQPHDSFTYPLFEAIKNKDKNLVELLLKEGANPNLTNKQAHPLDSVYRESTPLFEAVRLGQDEIVSLLLRYGADANQTSVITKSKLSTPLIEAAMSNASSHCFRMLLAAGADPFLAPSGGYG